MKLYHGTWEDTYGDILKDGEIKNYAVVRSEATKLIDEAIEKFTGKDLRRNAIFLSNDIESIEAYAYGFVVDISNLDKDFLYVGDFSLIDDLYYSIMCKEPDEKIRKLIGDYIDSFISFERYINVKSDISFPEFLYFKNISLDIAKVLES